MSGIVDDLRLNVNGILKIRDDIGAALKTVFMVTRTWSGTELGDGTSVEVRAQMLPSPRVVEFKSDVRIKEGGFVKVGDILLKMVSRQNFPHENMVDGTSEVPNIEKFYEVGGVLYRVINVATKHLTWNILLRPISDQSRSE